MDFELSKDIAEFEAMEKEYEEKVARASTDLKRFFQRIVYIEGQCHIQNNQNCLNQIDNYWLALKQIDREESKADTIIQEKCEQQVPAEIRILSSDSNAITSRAHYNAVKAFWECNAESRENFKNFALRRAKILTEAFTNLKQFLPQKPN